MRLSRYVKVYQSPLGTGYHILYSTKRASMALVRDTTLSAIEQESLPHSQQKTLLRLGMLVDDSEQELQDMVAFFDRLNEARTAFTATIVLNLDCNLACTYCYEQGVKTKEQIARSSVDAFVDYVKGLDFPRTREVAIDFYGGEPLLSIDTILYLSEKLKEAGEKLGFKYWFRLVTNGTLLTANIVERLMAVGLTGARITLDGPERLHNLARPFAGGRGSFSRIIANIKEVCELINIQIGGNYTVDTYKSFPYLLEDLMEKGVTPDRVALVKFDPVADSGRLHGAPSELGTGCISINEEWLFEASIFLREEILKKGYRTPKVTSMACVVELGGDFVLNADGVLYKCPGMLGRREFVAGTIQNGLDDYEKAYNLGHWKNLECLECAYLPLCFGGCRLMNLLKTGFIAGTDCRKPFFDATLESFIRQEIRYKSQLVGPQTAHPPGTAKPSAR
jgi:uncharacterized protein